MATQFGSIDAQYHHQHGLTSVHTHSHEHTTTVRPNDRTITAWTALSRVAANGTSPGGDASITRVVAGGSSQDFQPGTVPFIHRTRCTEITFRVAATHANVRAIVVINYWNI